VREFAAGAETRDVEIHVLVDRHRLAARLVRSDETPLVGEFGVLEFVLLVTRRIAGPVRNDPDLQKVYKFTLRRVEFRVRDAGTGRHALQFAGADHRAGADAILVFERAFEHPGEDLHVAMAVCAETLAGLDSIFIDDAQRAETHVARIVVIAE